VVCLKGQGIKEYPAPKGESQFFQRTPGNSLTWAFVHFGHACFLDKRPHFSGLPEKYFNFLGFDFRRQKKGGLHEPSKNKKQTERR